MTEVFEDGGHVVGIPARCLRDAVVLVALVESGARVACAVADGAVR